MWKRVVALWAVVRLDLKVLWFALKHPQSPTWLKFGALGLLAYLLIPIDLIPDVIPVLGVVDDLVLIPLALRWLLSRLPRDIREHAMRQARGDRVGDVEIVDMPKR